MQGASGLMVLPASAAPAQQQQQEQQQQQPQEDIIMEEASKGVAAEVSWQSIGLWVSCGAGLLSWVQPSVSHHRPSACEESSKLCRSVMHAPRCCSLVSTTVDFCCKAAFWEVAMTDSRGSRCGAAPLILHAFSLCIVLTAPPAAVHALQAADPVATATAVAAAGDSVAPASASASAAGTAAAAAAGVLAGSIPQHLPHTSTPPTPAGGGVPAAAAGGTGEGGPGIKWEQEPDGTWQTQVGSTQLRLDPEAPAGEGVTAPRWEKQPDGTWHVQVGGGIQLRLDPVAVPPGGALVQQAAAAVPQAAGGVAEKVS
jgi:hypothetical protein